MRSNRILGFSVLLLIVVLLAGCGKPYVITQQLEAPPEKGTICGIGDIKDALPFDFEESKKPTAENIAEFKTKLVKALLKKKLFGNADIGGNSDFEITGSILAYKKGNGFLRFMFGMFAGTAKVTIALQLTETKTNKIVFSGNFTRAIGSWLEKGDKMFDYVANDFASALKKQIKNLEKNK